VSVGRCIQRRFKDSPPDPDSSYTNRVVFVLLGTTAETRDETAKGRRTLNRRSSFLSRSHFACSFSPTWFHTRVIYLFMVARSHSAEWPTRKHKVILKFNCLGEENTKDAPQLLCLVCMGWRCLWGRGGACCSSPFIKDALTLLSAQAVSSSVQWWVSVQGFN
jgi:hypothetical protein